jgi:hypothetical protein
MRPVSRVEPLGTTCGSTRALATSALVSAPQIVNFVVDGKFSGVSGRVAISGVLCFGYLFSW